MLDIRRIKENPDAIKAGLKAKEVDCDAIVDRILELDVEIRALKTLKAQWRISEFLPMMHGGAMKAVGATVAVL